GGDADADEIICLFSQGDELRLERIDRRLTLRGIWSEQLLIHDPAHAVFEHGVDGDAGITRIGIRRDARGNSLFDARARRVEEHFGREYRPLRGCESQNPSTKIEILEKAPHRRELEVTMRVHQ